MALHEVQLKGYSVRPGNLSLGTFDSYGIEQLHVTADDSWDGLDILAVFHAPNGDAKKIVVGADGMLNVPPEATAKQAGNGRIVFVGLAENVQRITVDMGYNIKTHSDIEGDNPGVPTPDVVQQILGNSSHAVSIATAAQASAENARLAAEDAAKKAGEEAGGAAYSAAAAKKSAEDAVASSKIAAGNAEASASSANVANKSAEASQAAQSSAESSAQSAAKSARAAADSAASIVGAQEQSAASADAARDSAQQAKKASDSAAESASASKEAATQAIESSTSAANSAADAKAAKTAAAEFATAAAKSATDADNTANSIKDSMMQIAANKEAVSQLKEDTTALQKRQNVLVGSETGNPIAIDDAFDAPLCGLTVYGKSTQDGTPSPDNPVPIVSAGDGGSVVVKVSDGNGKEQTLTLQTPTGLPGIPVTSGGNYTDQNGQQWICDEVDLERGVKVQRVKSRRILSSEVKDTILGVNSCYIIEQNMTRPANNRQIWHIMCTHLERNSWNRVVDNGVQGICVTADQSYIGITIQGFKSANEYRDFMDKNEVGIAYELATPIETPLTPAEIAAYKDLTAYAPDTVVQASDGAGVKLEYQKDVNIAIKKLEDAIASMTAT